MKRRILCIFPRYTPSFGTFEHAYSLRGNTRAFMPPQGLLVIAAAAPSDWEVRFLDENIAPARETDFAWAEAVFVSGMHVQRAAIEDINRRAHRLGKTTVLGGPSVSACPEQYPDFDYVHIGELGDATDQLFERLAACPARPRQQICLRTLERRPLRDFPAPAYALAHLQKYFIGSVQFSSGCPYQCEFCDIPALYGRVPRLKTPEQVLRELDTQLAAGQSGAVYFVDDNFIGNRQRAKALLLELTAWQMRHHHPFRFTTEASLNLADDSELLQLFEAAGFTSVFLGIETPNESALITARKLQNTGRDLLASIRAIQLHGIEVMGGFILGFDTDCEDIFDRLADFIQSSAIPIAMVGLLQAVPGTRLYRRLVEEGRILTTSTGNNTAAQLNFLPRMNPSSLIEGYRGVLRQIYSCDAYYERVTRFLSQCQSATRLQRRARLSLTSLRALFSSLFRQGILDRHRLAYWRFVLTAATRYRRSFGTAMTLAVMGYHFQRITDQLCNQRS